MKLVTYQRLDGTWQAGEWRDGAVYSLGKTSILDIIRKGGEVDTSEQFKLQNVPPLRFPYRPPKILCVGRNYPEHATELGNELPKSPLIFSKLPTSVIGDGDPIQWEASLTEQVDWEGELGVIIGTGGKNIREEDAMAHVFGYALANDVTARDLQERDKQWVRAKGMDSFCPLASYVVTADEIPDPHALTIETFVNGERVQHGSTGEMFFKIPFLIAYLSRTFTLESGDLILTGTPAGVGKGMKPPRFLAHGDTVSVRIAEIGTLTNPCVVL
jgi:2-keto-4-pentenoate hydratase/2-oxohepta-3-ene-1,7-dioic acid hydratase in catechol pathway